MKIGSVLIFLILLLVVFGFGASELIHTSRNLVQAEGEVEKLAAEVEALKLEIETLKGEKTDLQRQVQLKDAKLAEMEQQLQETGQSLKDAQAKLDGLNSTALAGKTPFDFLGWVATAVIAIGSGIKATWQGKRSSFIASPAANFEGTYIRLTAEERKLIIEYRRKSK